MKILVPDVPLRGEMGALPEGVELVSQPGPDVEMVVLARELSDDVAQLLVRLPNLRVVQSFSAGVDWLLPLVPEGVIVCGASGVHDAAVSEWVMAVILAMGRRLPEFSTLQRHEIWDRAIADPESGNQPIADLDGQNVLVVGHGSIGRALAERLVPFGARVIGVAQHTRPGVETSDALPRLLPEAAVVVDLLPFTPATERFCDADFFAQMKQGALFVNAGRGRTVDTDALVEALHARRIRAALDVTDPEPLPAGHALWHAPDVLITPHIAGTVARWEGRAYRFAGDQVRRYAAGEPLLGVVTRG